MRLGIIGTGQVCWGHVEAIAKIREIEIVALCDPYPRSLKKIKEVLEKEKISSPYREFRNYRELLRMEEVEAVLIATPNYTHRDIAIESLEQGKHVLCEKPLATTVRECREIMETVKRTGKKLQVGLELRHSPLYQKVKTLLDKKEIGKPWLLWYKEFRGPFLKKVGDWILQKEKSGGSLVEKDCHHFDLFNWYVKKKPLRVTGFGGNQVIYRDRDVLDHAWVVVEYEGGAKACLGLCFFSPYGHETPQAGIIGDKGKMDISEVHLEITLWKRAKPLKKVYPVYVPPDIKEIFHMGSGYYQWKHFLKVVKGEAEPFPDAEIGLWSVAIPQAGEIAIAERRIVEIEEVLNA